MHHLGRTWGARQGDGLALAVHRQRAGAFCPFKSLEHRVIERNRLHLRFNLSGHHVVIGRSAEIERLAVDGERGVAELLQNYQADLRLTMGLSGVRSLSELNPDCLLQKSS